MKIFSMIENIYIAFSFKTLFTILFGFNSFWMFDIIERFKFEVFYALLDPANIP
jgi:hypothetical protein